MLDLLTIIIIIIILLLLLFLTRGRGYRIYPRDKKGEVTKVTNRAPNIAKSHERKFQNSLVNQGQNLLPLLPAIITIQARLPPLVKPQKRSKINTNILYLFESVKADRLRCF